MAQSVTYNDVLRKESLLDLITDISPKETQLYTGLEKSKASNTLHEWGKDALNTVGDNAQIEGSDPSYPARVDATRPQNVTQIIRREFKVSDTERAVDSAGYEDRYAREGLKAMKEWKNDAEFALMRGSQASGNGSATARRMKGVKNAITTNKTVQSGISFSEAILNDLIELTWNAGGDVDEIYVGAKLKRRISGFTAGTTKFTEVDNDDRRLINKVSVYESDFGVHKVFKHRYITQAGDNNYDIVGLQSDKFRVAHLREPRNVELAKTGDSDNAMIIGELTLEYLAEDSSFLGQAYL